VEECRQLRRAILLHGRQGIGVDLEPNLDLLVRQPFLHNCAGHVGLQEERGAGMPQPMKFDAPYTRGLGDPPVFVLRDESL
jgi:hypothetical protein